MSTTSELLAKMLALHQLWLDKKPGGKRFVASELVAADPFCEGTSFVNANLAGADLRGIGVHIWWDFLGANLCGADFRGADLVTCYFRSGTNLTGADLRGANLPHKMTGAILTGVLTDYDIPAIPAIDAKIVAAIEEKGSASFDMCTWHSSCGTAHCRAGWAIVLAGEAGRKLELAVGSNRAGALIYAMSRPGEAVPNFYTIDEVAMIDMKRCAAEQRAQTIRDS